MRGTSPIPLFLLIAIAILFLAHYFLYVSALCFFGTVAFEHRAALAAVLTVLPVSVIASSILAHRRNGLVTRVVYFCSSLWLGVGLTLFTALALAWAAWGASKIFGQNLNPHWLGAAALGLAAVYSCYGVVNAWYPRVVKYSVRIRNLPRTWQGQKLVHISDVHLGTVFGERFLARVVAKINAQSPATVLITGDLFDGSRGNLEKLVRPLHNLTAPKGTYFVTGNHETYLGTEHAYAALRNTPVRILDDECVAVDGMQVIGVSYPHGRQALSFAARLAGIKSFNPALPSILLYHSPSQVAAAKAAGINLQLSGHVHQGQIFPFQFITRMIFGKYHHGLHTEGDYTICTTSGVGVWGPTLRTGNHPEIVVINLQSAD